MSASLLDRLPLVTTLRVFFRNSLALFGFLALGACSDSAGPGLTHAFEARLTVNGQSRRVASDSTRFELYCATDGPCSKVVIIFTAANLAPGMNGNTSIFLSANNPPTVDYQLLSGTYPFHDISPFDIGVEVDPPSDGFWIDNQIGTLTISRADSLRLSGNFTANLISGNINHPLQAATLQVTFDLLLEETPGFRP